MIKYLATFSLLFFFGQTAFAQTANPTSATTDTIQSFRSVAKTEKLALANAFTELKNERKAKRQDKQLELSKAYLNRLINVREKTISKIEDSFNTGRCKNISDEAKRATLAEISEVKTNLASQKSEIDAITLDKVKDLARRIIEENRVFMIVAPASNEICSSQKIIYIIDNKVTPLLTKIEKLDIDLTQIKNYLNTAKTDAKSAYDLALKALQTRSTTPIDLVVQAREKIQSAKTALGKARELIDALGEKTPTPTSSGVETE